MLDAVRKISGRKAAELSDDQIFASYKRGRDAHPERSSEVMFHVYRYLAKELGLPADDAACDSVQLAVLRWQPFSDSVEALKRLRTKFRLVAMTNADRVALSCYAHALDNPFHDTICADDTGVAKPNPEFFAYNKGRAVGVRLQAVRNPARGAEPASRHRYRPQAWLQGLLDRAAPGHEGLWRHARGAGAHKT